LFVVNGADLSVKTATTEDTLLHTAVALPLASCQSILPTLLKHNDHLETKNKLGETALDVAMKAGNSYAENILLEKKLAALDQLALESSKKY